MWLIAYAIAAFSYVMTNLLILRMLQVAVMTDGLWSFFIGIKPLADPNQRRRIIWSFVFGSLTVLMIVAGSEIQRIDGVALNISFQKVNNYGQLASLAFFLSILGVCVKQRYDRTEIVRLLFSFNGRINRAKYWLGLVIAYAVGCTVYAVGAFLPPDNTLSFLFGLTALLGVVPLLAIFTKRLHDLSLSGWWTQPPLAILLVPLILLASYSDDARYSVGVGMIYPVLVIISLVWLGFAKGVTGPNRYGPDPLQRQFV